MPDDSQRRRHDGLHAAAWPDMFANLQSAYAELTRAQFELERRAAEVNHARDLFERVVESMSEGLFLLDRLGHIQRANRAASALTRRAEAISSAVGSPSCSATRCRTHRGTCCGWRRTEPSASSNSSFACQARQSCRSTSPARSCATPAARLPACWRWRATSPTAGARRTRCG